MAGKRNLVKAAEAGEAWNSARQLRALGSRIAQLADRWHGSKERGPGVSTRTRFRAGTQGGYSSRRTAWVRATARAR